MIKVLIVLSNMNYSCLALPIDHFDSGVAYNVCSQNHYGEVELFIKTDFVVARF